MYQDEDLLALSGIQHIAYCERQWALIHLEQVWADNPDTVAGELFHKRTDTPGYSSHDGVVAFRKVRLTSHELGIYGVADIVEYQYESTDLICVTPIEYKVGRPKAEDWDRVQVAAQAMCLEEMLGLCVKRGALFYGKTRRREEVIVSEELRDRVNNLTQRMHELFNLCKTPRPIESRHCSRCSIHYACLPSSGEKLASQYWRDMGEKVDW